MKSMNKSIYTKSQLWVQQNIFVPLARVHRVKTPKSGVVDLGKFDSQVGLKNLIYVCLRVVGSRLSVRDQVNG